MCPQFFVGNERFLFFQCSEGSEGLEGSESFERFERGVGGFEGLALMALNTTWLTRNLNPFLQALKHCKPKAPSPKS